MTSGSGSRVGNTNAPEGGSGATRVLRKNAPGNKSDPGWKHGFIIDGDNRKIKCKYCSKVISGGVYRLKHHLACTKKDVGGCTQVPEDVKKEIFDILYKIKEQHAKKARVDEPKESVDEHDGADAQVGEGMKESKENIEVDIQNARKNFKRRSCQATINSMYKKEAREEACQYIAKFFYNNAIPFNVTKSDEFHRMCSSIARHGVGFKAPSYHEIRVKYLKKEVELTKQVIETHKIEWKKVGCTIMIDGWTDRRRRTSINFLVNSPKGTIFLKSIDASHISKTTDKIFKMIDDVVEEVGEDNVVQVVTANATTYKLAGEKLMEKRKNIYWTPCAAHCIDLMLEDFAKKINIHKETIARGRKITTYIYSLTSLIELLQHFTQGKDLIRPAVTRFATSYLTLGCLQDNKGALMRMFTSDEWKSTRYQKTKEGKQIEDIALDNKFWKNVVFCLKAAYPLIKVLRLVDPDEKPAMGFIYEEMDRAKENIQKAYNGVKRCYEPVWNIIDARWDNQLHRPLHAAAYYLNPRFQYDPTFSADLEVKRGLYDCLQRMVPDTQMQVKIDVQLEDFKRAKNFFGSVIAKNGIHAKSPAEWWDSYGYEYPEAQNFAIRILSLTCSSSGYERNWSAFERVHTKKINRLKQNTMNDVLFVMANTKLDKKRQIRKASEYNVDDLSSDDEWIVAEGLEEENVESDDNEIQVGEENQSVGNVESSFIEDLTLPDDEVDIDDTMEKDRTEDNLEDEDDAIYDGADLNDLL